MLESLLTIDKQLFSVIYSLPHPFFIVCIMEFFSLIGYFGAVWLVLAVYFKKVVPVTVALLLTLIIVDIGLKFAVGRVRPYPSTLDQFLPWESYSFPSGHAAAAVAAAYILLNSKSKTRKKYKNLLVINHYSLFIWLLVVTISFSRVYLGRHYPLDIIAGGIIGWGIGWSVNKMHIC